MMKISYATPVYIITTICQLLCVTANSGYFIVGPSVFRESVDHLLSVIILNASVSIGVEVKLYSGAQGHLISSAERTIFGRGTVKLTIPAGVKGSCTLKVCGNCKSPKNGSYSFYNSTVVTVVDQPASLFIQTDKPVYRPGQTVFVNFITTSPDLKPLERKLTAYVLDPQGTKIVRWKKFEAFCCGLKSSSFELSHQPPFGTWSIFAELQGQTYSRSFSVGNYVEPKFEVTLHLPNFITDWNVCETLTIEAKYGYGKAVHGHATVKLQILGSDYYDGTDGVVVTKTTQVHGNTSVDVCMTELVDARDFGKHFRGRLNVKVEVAGSKGSVVAIANDSCVVDRQMVNIKFTKDTPKYFRPGLPYGGKLSVRYPDGSLASNITVQVKTEIDGTDVVFEDFTSHDGLVFFLIKSIPITSHSVQISAKVIKIGEFSTENYVSIYLTIVSWHSLSGCHLLIDSSHMQALMVGDAVKFQVQSNCHCSFKMNYEVVSKGNIVYSGNHFARRIRKRFSKRRIARHINSEERYEDGNHTCNMSIKFLVTHEMMPISRLVVYYFRSDGEAVADVMTFSVKPEFKHKMSVELSRTEVHPGHTVALTIQSLPGSCICLRGIDKSVYFYNQNSRLSTREVFEGVERSDTSRQRSSDTHSRSWEGLGNQPSIFSPWKTFGAKTSLFAFEEAQLMILTDTVHVQQDIIHRPELPFNLPGPDYQHLEGLSTLQKSVKRKIRPLKLSYFPETWIWSCFNMSEITAVENMNFTTPDVATSWIIDGFSLSSSHGLSLLESPTQMRAVKSFFVQMDLPHSVIKGEEVQIPVIVHNHLSTCVVVELSVRASAGVTIVSLPQARRFCLWRKNVETIEFSFVFQVLGLCNVSVDAVAFEESRCCSGHLSDENDRFSPSPIDSDYIQHTILVEPIGFTESKTQSTYFCTNERIYLNTPNRYDLQYFEIPVSWKNLSFSVRASNDVRVSLSHAMEDNDTYEIVIGGYQNTYSWISKGTQRKELISASSSLNILSAEEFRRFWIGWDNESIMVGFGDVPESDSVFLRFLLGRPLLVNYVGFSTGWGSTGEFKLWKRKDAEPEFGKVFHLTLPKKVVRGSEKATISVISDPMGLALNNIGELLRLPSRSEEQNLLDFSRVLCVLRYLRAAKHLTLDFEEKAIAALTKGYQTQLKYRRTDGSYSEFGDKDMYGNIWLTAFFLKSFHQAKEFIYIDDSLMKETLSWIFSQQNEDGSFSYYGRIMNKNIQHGRHSNVALTAHVIAALSQLPANEHMHRTVLTKSQFYLESHTGELIDPYTASLAAYALIQLNSHMAEIAVRILSDFAIKRDGLMFWKNHVFELNTDVTTDSNELTVASVDTETSGYALLTYISCGDVTSALLVVKWLLMQQNSLGEFSSAQSTDIAMSALAEFAKHKFDRPTNLTIHLASLNSDLLEKLEIADDLNNVIQEIPVPSVPTILFVRAEGDGCALIQVVTSYSILSPRHRVAFSLSVIVKTLESEKVVNLTESTSGRPNVETKSGHNPTRIMIYLRICTRWLYPGSSNIAVMEISLLSGFSPDLESLHLLTQNGIIKGFDVKQRIIQLYFDEIPSSCKTCIELKAQREFQIRKIHPVPVKIYDYYEPMLEGSVMYSGGSVAEMVLCDSCENDTCSRNVSDINHVSSVNDSCDSSSRCCTFEMEFDLTKTCSCHYACPLYASPVCASNGRIYGSRCAMEKDSCLTGQHLFVVAFGNCYKGFGENESEEEKEDEGGEEEEEEAVEDSTKGISLKVTNSQHGYSVYHFSHLSATYSVVRSEEGPVASYEDNRIDNGQEEHPEDQFKTLGHTKYSDEINASQINTAAYDYSIDNTTTFDKNLSDNLANHALLSTTQSANINEVWEEFYSRANETAQNGTSSTSPTVSMLHVSSTDFVGSTSDRSFKTVTQSVHKTSETNFDFSAIMSVESSSNHMNFVQDNSTAELMFSVLNKSWTEALDDSNFTRGDHSSTNVTATMLANKEESLVDNGELDGRNEFRLENHLNDLEKYANNNNNELRHLRDSNRTMDREEKEPNQKENLTENQKWISKPSNHSVTSFTSYEENLASDVGKASKTTNIVAAFDLTVVDFEEKSLKVNQPYDETVTNLQLSSNSQSAFYTKQPLMTSVVKHSSIHHNQIEGKRHFKLQKPVKTGFENDVDKLTYDLSSQTANDYVQDSESAQSLQLVNHFQDSNTLDVSSLENEELSTAPTTKNGFTGTISSGATSELLSLSYETSKMDMPSTELADAIASTATTIERNNDKFIVETTTAKIAKKYEASAGRSIGSYVTTVPQAGQVFISDEAHSEFPHDLETFSNQPISDDGSNGQYFRSAPDDGALELAVEVNFKNKKLISNGKVWKPTETELVTEESLHELSTLAYRKIVNVAEPGHDLSISTITDDHDSSRMNLEIQVSHNEHLAENDAVKVNSEIPPTQNEPNSINRDNKEDQLHQIEK